MYTHTHTHIHTHFYLRDFPGGSVVKTLKLAVYGTQVQSLVRELKSCMLMAWPQKFFFSNLVFIMSYK